MRSLILISITFLCSCQKIPKDNVYHPPSGNNEIQNILYLDIGMDKATNKIEHLINQENSQNSNIFEFKTEVELKDIPKYIDCGKMNDEIYVSYINRIFDSSLDIKTSIRLDPESNKSTRVEISSDYLFTSIETGTSWRFATNKPKLILVGNPAYGAEPYRKCHSKNLIESQLLEEITEFNK
jgi:hypothetical protein